VQALKADILAGRLGAPRRLRTRVAWPRDSVYYGRNSWAGRLHDAAGRWVLDSPVNNAVAHYLFNMLYVIGPRVDLSARPLSVAGELYRANAIENYDAACLRVRTEPEAELLFYAAHCVRVSEGPIFVYEFEKAEVRYEGKGSIVAFFRNGEQRDYGAPDGVPDVKLAWCLAAARNAGPPVPCGIEAARSHTLVMNGLQEAGVRPFPVERVSRVPWGPEGRAMLTCVDGLEEDLRTAFEAGALFSETGRPWASPAHFRDLREYRAFPVGGETVCRDAAAVPPAARP
jgi:predicted dehydrogenase